MSQDYAKAKKLGEREYRRRIARGQYPYLPSLDEMVSGVEQMPEISLGSAEIPLDMIAGTRTAGRRNAFAANFMPLMGEDTEFAVKWSSLCSSQMEEGIRDPLKVYEFMNRFYVEEGNKRVSVLNYVGAVTVFADVIRIRPPRTDSEQSRLYYEYLDFYKVTNSFEIVFSSPGRYEQLARILEQNLCDPWPEELLEKLHTGFIAFKEIYISKGGRKLSLTVADALLIYLGIYSLDSLIREGSNEMRMRAFRLRLKSLFYGGVDILVTHAPAKGWGDLEDLPHRGFQCFNTFLNSLRPKCMFHGHVHKCYGSFKREHIHESGTRLINAWDHYYIDI